MFKILYVSAYGRSYKNKHEVLHDWIEGKDFKIVDGPYISIREVNFAEENGIEEIRFLFGDNLKQPVRLWRKNA